MQFVHFIPTLYKLHFCFLPSIKYSRNRSVPLKSPPERIHSGRCDLSFATIFAYIINF